MTLFLSIGIGGFFGAISRYYSTVWLNEAFLGAHFPYGTFLVNVVGSLLLGFCMAIFQNVTITPELRLMLTSGFLGAFTTFSSFSVETLVLLQNGDVFRAFLYVSLSVLLGLAMAYVGFTIGKMI